MSVVQAVIRIYCS